MISLLFLILCEESVLLENKLHLHFLLFELVLCSSSHVLLLISKHFQHLLSSKFLPLLLLCESISLCLLKSLNIGTLLLFERLLTLFLLGHNGFKEVALALGRAFGELLQVRNPLSFLFLQHPRVLVLKFYVFLL